MEDTFGRLPNDVINKIDSMYHKPIIKLIQTSTQHGVNFSIRVKYPYVTCEFPLILGLVYYLTGNSEVILYCNKCLDELKEFIDKLEKNEYVAYKYENDCRHNISYINIDVGLNNITITYDTDIKMCTIDIENKDNLLCIMKEYYNILLADKTK